MSSNKTHEKGKFVFVPGFIPVHLTMGSPCLVSASDSIVSNIFIQVLCIQLHSQALSKISKLLFVSKKQMIFAKTGITFLSMFLLKLDLLSKTIHIYF